MKNKLLLLLCFMIFLGLNRDIQAAGLNSFEFLMIGVGARAQGVSGAYTAISDDVNSIYWNQAGLGLVNSRQASFMHNVWVENISYDYAAAAFPTKSGTVGLSVHYLNMSDMIGRESQISQPYNFGASNSMISIAYGKKLINNCLIGANIKYISEQIENIRTGGVAADIGFIYRLSSYPVNLGAAIHNLGKQITFVRQSEDLPLTVNLGASYMLGGTTIGLDFKHVINDKSSDISIGMEYNPFNAITVRGGTTFKLASESSSVKNNFGSDLVFSGGLGLKLGNSSLDYALTSVGDFGVTHNISLTFGF